MKDSRGGRDRKGNWFGEPKGPKGGKNERFFAVKLRIHMLHLHNFFLGAITKTLFIKGNGEMVVYKWLGNVWKCYKWI